MHAPIHLAISWLIGHTSAERRDRRLVAWSGVAPDLDALSLLGGVGAYVNYHHVLTHGVVAAVGLTLLWTALARQRLKVLLLSLVAFHVHVLCDFVGSGADGQNWPIVYFYPFTYREYVSPYGWDLASPANAWSGWRQWLPACGSASGTGGPLARRSRTDAAVVNTLRKVISRKSNHRSLSGS